MSSGFVNTLYSDASRVEDRDASEDFFEPLEDFFAASARGIVEAQQALDAHGRGRLLAWEEQGLPPTVWMCSNCRLRFPVAFDVRPKTRLSEPTQLKVAPRQQSQGHLSLSFRYIPTPSEES